MTILWWYCDDIVIDLSMGMQENHIMKMMIITWYVNDDHHIHIHIHIHPLKYYHMMARWWCPWTLCSSFSTFQPPSGEVKLGHHHHHHHHHYHQQQQQEQEQHHHHHCHRQHRRCHHHHHHITSIHKVLAGCRVILWCIIEYSLFCLFFSVSVDFQHQNEPKAWNFWGRLWPSAAGVSFV